MIKKVIAGVALVMVGVVIGACGFTKDKPKAEASQPAVVVLPQPDPWGEIEGDPVILSRGNMTAASYLVRHKKNGTLHMVTVAGSNNPAAAGVTSHQVFEK